LETRLQPTEEKINEIITRAIEAHAKPTADTGSPHNRSFKPCVLDVVLDLNQIPVSKDGTPATDERLQAKTE
jgi:hypothetical protein